MDGAGRNRCRLRCARCARRRLRLVEESYAAAAADDDDGCRATSGRSEDVRGRLGSPPRLRAPRLRRLGRPWRGRGRAARWGDRGPIRCHERQPLSHRVRRPRDGRRPRLSAALVPGAAARPAERQRRAIPSRITIDLSQRRLTLYENGTRTLTAVVAVGAPATPTPTGRYYVNQRLVPEDPAGPYGPGAVGISAFSDVLTGWTQGGPVAIHGTNEPWSIGGAVSNGCIRLPNATLRKVFAAAVAGTPVLITA
jgi:lipoprotein-anchoring transpeptidase ErfK/SrfK